jgi:single-stranded DNA-binding protein
VQGVQVAVFGKAAEKAAALKKAERCYVEGTIKLDTWRGQDGADRHSLSVAAFKCEPTHRIGRNRPKRKASDKPNSQAAPAQAACELNDEIPW